MKEKRLRSNEWILGLAASGLFALGVAAKYLLWPGGSLLSTLGVGALILGYLPVHYIRHRRKARTRAEKIYLALKVATWSMLALGSLMIMQFWVGGSTILLLGKLMVVLLAGIHLWMGLNRIPRATSLASDLVALVFILTAVYILQHPRHSRYTLNNQQMMLDYYQAQVSGMEKANDILYLSIDSASSVPAIGRLRTSSRSFHRVYDSIMLAFVDYCNLDGAGQSGDRFSLDPRLYTSGEKGEIFFMDQGNSRRMAEIISDYSYEILSIAGEYHLSGALIGAGLELQKFINPYGDTIHWEHVIFLNKTVASIMENLFWTKQIALWTENAVLTGLLGQADLSVEMEFLQALAARESERAMKEKEDEIMRIRQSQALQALQLEQSETMLQQRKVTIISAFSVIALILALLIFSTRAYLRKQKDNRELEQHRDEISRQRDEISARNGEITSSIDYARRLQASILPSPGLLNTRIRDHFVLFKPKHMVSGDFYWWTQVEDNVVITAADCTGHGVPGAFMSMLGVSMLREIVSKEYISHPGVILRRLRKEVIHALKQTGEFGEQKDGMDLALVSINVDTLVCQYAGANNPLYLVRDGELTVYKPDRMPVSIHQTMDRFTTHEFQLRQGDHLYMFSDGYADQFGGPLGKKFKYQPFREMLIRISGMDMEAQLTELSRILDHWMRDVEQVDDILILGLEI